VPRFYFDVWEGDRHIRDDTGLELDSLDAAEGAAAEGAAEIGRDYLPKGNARDVTVEVRNEQGRQIVSVRVSIEVHREELAPVYDPATSHKAQYGTADFLDGVGFKVVGAMQADASLTILLRTRDDCCARPMGAGPTSAGRHG
jgi:hypothetical protein